MSSPVTSTRTEPAFRVYSFVNQAGRGFVARVIRNTDESPAVLLETPAAFVFGETKAEAVERANKVVAALNA